MLFHLFFLLPYLLFKQFEPKAAKNQNCFELLRRFAMIRVFIIRQLTLMLMYLSRVWLNRLHSYLFVFVQVCRFVIYSDILMESFAQLSNQQKIDLKLTWTLLSTLGCSVSATSCPSSCRKWTLACLDTLDSEVDTVVVAVMAAGKPNIRSFIFNF